MRTRALVAIIPAAVALTSAHAQPSPNDLVKALQGGGCVLVMRHARSPREAPTKDTANADNTRLERQLDEEGRRGAEELGNALRALRIPIGSVLTSPTYRAMETVKLARLDGLNMV